MYLGTNEQTVKTYAQNRANELGRPMIAYETSPGKWACGSPSWVEGRKDCETLNKVQYEPKGPDVQHGT